MKTNIRSQALLVISLLALSSLSALSAAASVTLGFSPFAKSPSNTGGIGASLSVDRNESSYTLNWVTLEVVAPTESGTTSNGYGSGNADYILSSGLFFPVNESVRLGGRMGLAAHDGGGEATTLGAFALRLHEKDSRFMFEVDLGVSGVGTSYGKAMFGWNLYR